MKSKKHETPHRIINHLFVNFQAQTIIKNLNYYKSGYSYLNMSIDVI